MSQTFGEFLSTKRKEKNLTQKELGNLVFVSESAVSKWEKDIARPDLSLLPELSEILGVTEHELITASVDETREKMLRQAKKWQRLSLGWNLFFYISYGLTLLICFIVNIAVSGNLSWFFVVFASLLLVASFTTIPQYITKYRLLLIPLTELASLFILFATCCIYTKTNWFFVASIPVLIGYIAVFLPIVFSKCNVPSFFKRHNAIICAFVDFLTLLFMLFIYNTVYGGKWFFTIALPLLSFGFAIILIMIAVIRYLKTNGFIKTGLCFGLWCGVYPLIFEVVKCVLERAGIKEENMSIPHIFSFNLSDWNYPCINNNVNFLIFASLLVLSLSFLTVGIFKRSSK